MTLRTEKQSEVIEALKETSAHPIVVDGRDGSGKSHLARRLSSALGLPVLDLDNYLTGKGGYVRNIDLERLASDLRGTSNEVIIAGLCALEILAKCSVAPGTIVYVQHKPPEGRRMGMTDFVCNTEISLEEALSHIGHGETKPGIRDLLREQAKYHREHDPKSRASVVFTRRSVYA